MTWGCGSPGGDGETQNIHRAPEKTISRLFGSKIAFATCTGRTKRPLSVIVSRIGESPSEIPHVLLFIYFFPFFLFFESFAPRRLAIK